MLRILKGCEEILESIRGSRGVIPQDHINDLHEQNEKLYELKKNKLNILFIWVEITLLLYIYKIQITYKDYLKKKKKNTRTTQVEE